MMNAMKRFGQQGETTQPSQPALRHDTPRRTVDRVARHSHMFDVLAPILQISRQKCRHEMHPEEIFPQTKCCHDPEDTGPDHSSQRQFRPNPTANALASNWRCRTEKGSQENKWAIEQSEI